MGRCTYTHAQLLVTLEHLKAVLGNSDRGPNFIAIMSGKGEGAHNAMRCVSCETELKPYKGGGFCPDIDCPRYKARQHIEKIMEATKS